jgi:hypothetical protein
MIVCALLSVAVWYFARDLDLYSGDDEDDDYFEMQDLKRKRDPKISSRRATPAARRRKDDPVTEEVDGVTLRREVEQLQQQPVEQEFRFNLMDLSDHMDDSMEVPSPNRPLSLY